MPVLPGLNLSRHDREHRTTITLAGEIDLTTVSLLGGTVEKCVREGIRTIDIDLTALTFCDVSGLNAFLVARNHTASAGCSLRLHHVPPILNRILDITGTGFLLHSPLPAPVLPPASDALAGMPPGLLAS
ncbi:STAS domain-containing protein [Streptomyces albipurpureus]|uniref:STAS domain-containing protein n=1 Tax=Streptomyces albipurpureus TaxID=2897419 RepID=A0ABT0UFZ3_9ACTN|nr:STAS domain-containing protein [Streptomyces sp. CWNU-1]MCM2387181.1 STAS domain-containing protein [Streptomyces sp. CWNU-1]